MDRVTIKNKIIEDLNSLLIIKNCEITEETYFIEDLDVSSIEIMELLADLENEYNITMPEEKMNQFVQIKDLVSYLDQRLNGDKDE